MKNFSIRVIGLLAISLIIFSCSKKSSLPEMKNSITYNGTQYDMNKGLLEYFGNIQGSGLNIDLILLSPGLTPVVTNGQVDSIDGTGSGINFEIFTSGPTSLDVRDYTFDATMSGSPGTFDYGNALIDFNTLTQEGITSDIGGGKITVKSNSPVYEISFNCTTKDGKSVTGYYKGSLPYYDMSSPTKAGLLKKRHIWYKGRK